MDEEEDDVTSQAAINRGKTRCPYGHEYTEQNTLRHMDNKGRWHRSCRTCAGWAECACGGTRTRASKRCWDCHVAAIRAGRDARFWAKVDKSGGEDACWPWTGARCPSGYGSFCVEGRMSTASRYAYNWQYGDLVRELDVLHRCDNPPCVNPAHLFLGSAADNRADCVAKGRHSHGERAGNAKLSNAQVAEVRRLRASEGLLQRDIAGRFGIHPSHVSRIVNRRVRTV